MWEGAKGRQTRKVAMEETENHSPDHYDVVWEAQILQCTKEKPAEQA